MENMTNHEHTMILIQLLTMFGVSQAVFFIIQFMLKTSEKPPQIAFFLAIFCIIPTAAFIGFGSIYLAEIQAIGPWNPESVVAIRFINMGYLAIIFAASSVLTFKISTTAAKKRKLRLG